MNENDDFEKELERHRKMFAWAFISSLMISAVLLISIIVFTTWFMFWLTSK